jgi:hypothetical protein
VRAKILLQFVRDAASSMSRYLFSQKKMNFNDVAAETGSSSLAER